MISPLAKHNVRNAYAAFMDQRYQQASKVGGATAKWILAQHDQALTIASRRAARNGLLSLPAFITRQESAELFTQFLVRNDIVLPPFTHA